MYVWGENNSVMHTYIISTNFCIIFQNIYNNIDLVPVIKAI